MDKCAHCNGRGRRTQFYVEVLDATGPFYDRNMVRELRSITVKCSTCNGTWEVVDEKAGAA